MPYSPSWNSPYVTTNPYQQPLVPTTVTPPSYQTQQLQQGVKKVNGPQSALQYPVAPNTQSEPLFDFNGKDFYIVSADSAGFKTIETFGFFRKENASEPSSQQITRDEFDTLVKKVNDMEAHYGIHGPVQPTATAAGTATTNGNAESQA